MNGAKEGQRSRDLYKGESIRTGESDEIQEEATFRNQKRRAKQRKNASTGKISFVLEQPSSFASRHTSRSSLSLRSLLKVLLCLLVVT